MEPTISITLSQYESLLEASLELDALEAMGVDNWDGYDDAMQLLREWKEGEE